MMILDVFEHVIKESESTIKSFIKTRELNKYILVADDSRFIRNLIKKFFEQLGLSYILYRDGKELIDGISKLDVNDIGLIVTDLEMPNLDGRGVIEYIRSNHIYNDIKIVVHTNMANDVMANDLMKNSISKVVGKVNLKQLGEAIYEFSK